MRRRPSFMLIIPQDILLDILIRLPTKDIGRCRCVSKLWRHILSELDFINDHLIRSKQCIDNELLLIKCSDSNTLFVAPLLEVLELHLPSHDLDTSLRDTRYGFGYDLVNDDYKVIALSCYFLEPKDEDEPRPEPKMFANVYSVKKGTWKQVESFPYLYDYAGVFVGGSIHWIATNYWDDSPFIVGFDVTEEKLWKVPAPGVINGDPCEHDELIILGGCLCMCNSFPRDKIDIWVMKEYGVIESWTKFTIVAVNGSEMIPYLGVPGQLELVVVKDYHTEDERLVVYNLDTGKFQDVTIKGIKAKMNGLALFSFLDGSAAIPPKTTTNAPTPPTTTPVTRTNPAYTTWYRQDQLILGALAGTLAPQIVALIANDPTSHDAWSTLSKTFANSSRGHRLQIKDRLDNISHTDNITITDYMIAIKSCTDDLAQLEHPMDVDDITAKILNGLNYNKYRPVIEAIRARDTPISFKALHEKLIQHELRLKNEP
ncbi:hypothetical protein KSS87_015495, partial [Heliosperma pusillum]